MQFSDEVLIQAGYTKIDPVSPIKATFRSINVYHISGISLEQSNPYAVYNAGNGITFALGDDIDRICMALLNDKFLDTEEQHEEWEKSNKTTPPYLMLIFAPPIITTANNGWWKATEDGIETYGTFTIARQELAKAASDALPPLLVALSSSLSDDKRVVSLRPITSIVDGCTPDGKRLHDYSLKMTANLSTAENPTVATVDLAIVSALNKQSSVSLKGAQWLQIGVAEFDPFEKFRSFFNVIEWLTEETFRAIKPQCKIGDLATTRIASCVINYRSKQGRDKDLRNLYVKFMWCTVKIWSHITEQDVELMYALKKIRDAASHGHITKDDSYPFHDAHLLAIKLFR